MSVRAGRLYGVILAASAFALGASGRLRRSGGSSTPDIAIPAGRPIHVDGKIDPGEWRDAVSVSIPVESGWTVRALVKRDGKNLYLAFLHLRHGSARLFPEVLIDAPDLRTRSWRPGQWWLHASHNLCEADGAFNIYQRDGVFLCSHTKPGWFANNPPVPGGITEFQITFAKLALASRPGTRFGLALDVTNATGDRSQIWRFWPAGARLAVPRTWAQAVLQ